MRQPITLMHATRYLGDCEVSQDCGVVIHEGTAYVRTSMISFGGRIVFARRNTVVVEMLIQQSLEHPCHR